MNTKGFEQFQKTKLPNNTMKIDYNFQNEHLTFLSINDKEIMRVYTEFERALSLILNRNYTADDLIYAKIQLAKQTYEFIKPGILKDTTDQQKLDLINFTLSCLEVTDQEIVDTANQEINEKLKKGESNQIIYGKQSDNLEMYVSQGWVVDRFAKGLSLQNKNYIN